MVDLIFVVRGRVRHMMSAPVRSCDRHMRPINSKRSNGAARGGGVWRVVAKPLSREPWWCIGYLKSNKCSGSSDEKGCLGETTMKSVAISPLHWHRMKRSSSPVASSPPTEEPKPEAGSSVCSSSSSSSFRLSTIAILVFLDLPYFIAFLFLLGSTIVYDYEQNYIEPQLKTLRWTTRRAASENTYYTRMCTATDASATTPEELLIRDDMKPNEIVDSMLTHGISIFPHLITPATAKVLRETIIEHNTIEDNFGVISNKHRYSYGIRLEQHPIVRQAAKEIVTSPQLAAALPPLMGQSPAIYKFHAITSSAGAADQYFHWDVKAEASSVQYSRSFAPIYSLFIPLQDTPVTMGPTELCPGSHVCSAGTAFCQTTSFQPLLYPTNATTMEPVWPLGYGALMNQQMTHRGRAHEGGPDRVVFILALTPQPLHNKLETRNLSLGGAYAVHWTQWGHTIQDFLTDTMYQPIKTLRSLGLYKPRHAAWGRDFVMTFLTKVANDELYDEDDLEYVVKHRFTWFPRFLLPPLPAKVDENEDGDSDDYIDYSMQAFEYFRAMMVNVRNASRRIYVTFALPVYLGCYLLMFLIHALRSRRQHRRNHSPLRSDHWPAGAAKKVLLLHMGLGVAFWLLQRRIASRPSSRHIRAGRLFTVPWLNLHGPNSPATLPWVQDVLLQDDFQSDYMASYTRFLEVGHPGNRSWKQQFVRRYSSGYTTLPHTVQSVLVDTVRRWILESQQGRFLTKNYENQWTRLSDAAARRFVHAELVRWDDNLKDQLVQQVAFLRSETKFGTFRDTALHRLHIPQYLNYWDDRFLRSSSLAVNNYNIASKETVGSDNPSPATAVAHWGAAPRSLTSLLNNSISRKDEERSWRDWEPFPGAWLEVGDRIDGLEDGAQPCKFFG